MKGRGLPVGVCDGGGTVLRPDGAGSVGPRVRLTVGERIARAYGGGTGAASRRGVRPDVRVLAIPFKQSSCLRYHEFILQILVKLLFHHSFLIHSVLFFGSKGMNHTISQAQHPLKSLA